MRRLESLLLLQGAENSGDGRTLAKTKHPVKGAVLPGEVLQAQE